MYEQNSFVPVARVVQLASHLQQKRLANIAYETRRFVRIGESDVVINQRIADKSQPILKIYHYHCNHLGTPQELTSQDGDVVWLSYDRAWGGSFDSLYKQQFVDNFAISENELQPFKFQGQSLDTETGLHYNRFRYYDSDVGMFVQRDPIELLGGSNIFQYASNPTGWIDALGLAKKKKAKPKPTQQETNQESQPKQGESCLPRLLLNPKVINFAQTSINRDFDTPEGQKNIQTVINLGAEQVALFPPIHVIQIKGQWIARDGNSRLLIARKTKAKAIQAIDETSCNQSRIDLIKRLRNNGLPNTGTSDLPKY